MVIRLTRVQILKGTLTLKRFSLIATILRKTGMERRGKRVEEERGGKKRKQKIVTVGKI